MPFLASFHHIVSVIPRFDKDLTAESGADSVQEVTEGFAVAGDISAAGSLILKALEQERRANGVGPQVLQLIKPSL